MQAGGAFMLGGEQDCYGGCTDASQAFYGLMDEVCTVVLVLFSQYMLCRGYIHAWHPYRVHQDTLRPYTSCVAVRPL